MTGGYPYCLEGSPGLASPLEGELLAPEATHEFLRWDYHWEHVPTHQTSSILIYFFYIDHDVYKDLRKSHDISTIVYLKKLQIHRTFSWSCLLFLFRIQCCEPHFNSLGHIARFIGIEASDLQVGVLKAWGCQHSFQNPSEKSIESHRNP